MLMAFSICLQNPRKPSAVSAQIDPIGGHVNLLIRHKSGQGRAMPSYRNPSGLGRIVYALA